MTSSMTLQSIVRLFGFLSPPFGSSVGFFKKGRSRGPLVQLTGDYIQKPTSDAMGSVSSQDSTRWVVLLIANDSEETETHPAVKLAVEGAKILKETLKNFFPEVCVLSSGILADLLVPLLLVVVVVVGCWLLLLLLLVLVLVLLLLLLSLLSVLLSSS